MLELEKTDSHLYTTFTITKTNIKVNASIKSRVNF